MSTFRILRFVERELSIEDYQKLLERKRQDLLTCCRNLPQRATVIQTCGVAVAAPKMEKQLEVVEHLDSLQEETQHLARIYERKLAALEALKKSLLHQAFTGEL
jgi:DNA-binding transcriptional MerR regulator